MKQKNETYLFTDQSKNSKGVYRNKLVFEAPNLRQTPTNIATPADCVQMKYSPDTV